MVGLAKGLKAVNAEISDIEDKSGAVLLILVAIL
jgi:hypothetical protein